MKIAQRLNYIAEMTKNGLNVEQSRQKTERARFDGSTLGSGPGRRFIINNINARNDSKYKTSAKVTGNTRQQCTFN